MSLVTELGLLKTKVKGYGDKAEMQRVVDALELRHDHLIEITEKLYDVTKKREVLERHGVVAQDSEEFKSLVSELVTSAVDIRDRFSQTPTEQTLTSGRRWTTLTNNAKTISSQLRKNLLDAWKGRINGRLEIPIENLINQIPDIQVNKQFRREIERHIPFIKEKQRILPETVDECDRLDDVLRKVKTLYDQVERPPENIHRFLNKVTGRGVPLSELLAGLDVSPNEYANYLATNNLVDEYVVQTKRKEPWE